MRLGPFLFDFRPFRPPVAIRKTRKTLGKKSAHLSHAHSNSTAVTVGVGHSATQQHRQGAQHRLKQGMPRESFSTPGPYPAGSHGTPCIRPGHCGTTTGFNGMLFTGSNQTGFDGVVCARPGHRGTSRDGIQPCRN